MYYEANGIIYREAARTDSLVWLVPCERPSEPFPAELQTISEMNLALPPKTDSVSQKRRATGEKRRRILSPLIGDDRCVFDRSYRNLRLKQTADAQNISVRTLREWYFSYLAKGDAGLYPAARTRKDAAPSERQKNFRWAINKYYFSSNRLSLREAYLFMLQDKYVDENGELKPDYPKYHQFHYFYYSHNNPVRRTISRDGYAKYKRSIRPLYGNTAARAQQPGTYEIDATQADVYLVSDDRTTVAGRPNIYLAADVATRMIAGVYVGFEAGEEAAVKCLGNAILEKQEYCAEYGVEIQPHEWPAAGMPQRVVTDRGREFMSERFRSVCTNLGIVHEGLPPYRPDLKGTVEKTLDCLQNTYKPLLKRKGIIEPDFAERGAPDYRTEARLTLQEFTEVVIRSILLYNNSRMQRGFVRSAAMIRDGVMPVASDIWLWHEKRREGLHPVTQEGCLELLPRTKGYFTRGGLAVNGLTYRNTRYHSRCARASVAGREEVVVAYRSENVSTVYLYEKDEYTIFSLTKASELYEGMSLNEVQRCRKTENTARKQAREAELPAQAAYIAAVREIIQQAEKAI